jgi:membrane protease YdiL (CAAX protease family)
MSIHATAEPQSRTLTQVRRYPLTTYFVLTYAVAWSLWLPLVVLRERMPAALGFLLIMLGSWVPSTVGVLLVAVLQGKPGVRTLLGRLLRWRVGLRWYVAVLVLPLLVPLGLGVSILLGGATPAVDATIPGVLVLFAFSIFPGSALGEELGWRGLALPRLQADHSALSASLVVGALWGSWHLPLWLTGTESHPIGLYPAFVVTVIATSVIITWIYNGAEGSLLVVVLYHAAANLPLSLLITPLGAGMTQPFLSYAALVVVAAVAVVAVSGPEHLSRTHRRQGSPTTSGGHRVQTTAEQPARPADW